MEGLGSFVDDIIMFSESEKDRYSRHFILDGFGEQAQGKLKSAKVLVIGAGGLGCPALQYLVAAGVGTIGIADGDVVSLSNLQRQVLYGVDDIGKNKAEVAKSHLSQLNPEIEIHTIPEYLGIDNILSIIEFYDVVIDGSDNFATRYLVNDACVIAGRPLVYGAVFKFTGQLSVFNFNGGPTYRCLFPEAPETGEMPGCGEIGVLGVLPGIIGTYQASEAIKIITGVGEVLSGKMMTIDLLENNTSYFEFKLVQGNRALTELKNTEYLCETVKEISWTEFELLRNKENVRLIDVREVVEFQRQNIGGENIPLSRFIELAGDFPASETLVIHCQSGVRAKKAVEATGRKTKVFLLKEVHWR